MTKVHDKQLPRRLSVALGLTAALLTTNAQAFRADQYVINLSPASNSLTQQTVGGLFQDRKGFVWILTQEGLNRFDGYDVINFTSIADDPTSLSHQFTLDIAEDAQGSLWIGTAAGGLNRFDETTFSFRSITYGGSLDDKHPMSNNVLSLAPSSRGGLWLGYGDKAAFSHLDTQEETFQHYTLESQNAEPSIAGFVEHDNGTLYVASSNDGVYQIAPGTSVIQRIPISVTNSDAESPKTPGSLTLLKDGKLLIASTTEGVYVYDPQSSALTRHPVHRASQSDSINQVYRTLIDAEGNQWFGTSSGIAIYDPLGNVTWLTKFNSELPDQQVLSLLQSRDGVVWLGTYNGLAQGKPALFQTFTAEDGLPSSAVFAFESDEQGSWWIGTERGISNVQATRNEQNDWSMGARPQTFLQDHMIMSIAASDNYVYAGSLNDGLFQIDLKKKIISRFQSSSSSLTSDGISGVEILDDGLVLVSTWGGGLNIFDETTGEFTALQHDPNSATSLSDDRIAAMLLDSTGKVWLGTMSGLSLLDTESLSFRRFNEESTSGIPITKRLILSLAEDKNGNILLGTRSGGLYIVDRSNLDSTEALVRRPEMASKVPSADIYGIVVDDSNHTWVSHNAGITRILADTLEATNFNQDNGLQGKEFNQGAAHKAADGTLLFGGQSGFNPIDPQKAYVDNYDYELMLTSFKLLNDRMFFEQPYSTLSTIELEHDYQFASMLFAALDYRNPEKTLYRYRIDGLHDEWIDLGRTRQIFVSGLGYGDYTVRVNATNESGTWAEQERRISFNITPPYWMTNLAFAVYTALAVIAVYWVYRKQQRKSRRELARRVELEEKVQERTVDLQRARVEAEKAARAKADFLAAMSHEIRTPMHGMLGMTDLLIQSGLSARQQSYARTASESGKSLLEIVNSILDYSKLEAGKLELAESPFAIRSVVEEVASLLTQSATASETSLHIVWENCYLETVLGDKGKLRQILINLIGNAIKFTDEGCVIVWCNISPDNSMEESNDRIIFSLTVEDTGIGIEQEKLDSVFDVFTQADASTTREFGGTGLGLSITKELVELMNGTLTVESILGEGSKFSAQITLKRPDEEDAPVASQNLSAFCVTNDTLLFRSIKSRLKFHGIIVNQLESLHEIYENPNKETTFLIDEQLVSTKTNLSELTKCGHHILARNTATLADADENNVILPPHLEADVLRALTQQSWFNDGKPIPADDQKLHFELIKNVLLVEDVQVNQQIAAQMLENIGIETVLADNGAAAVAQFKQQKFDAVLMDCQMPVLDGYEAARRIRAYELESKQGRTPIIALTAGGGPEDIERANNAGMDGLVSKPFSLAQLSSVVEKLNSGGYDIHGQDVFEKLDPGSDNDAILSNIIDHEVINTLIEMARTGDNSDLIQKLLTGFKSQFAAKIDLLDSALETIDKQEVKSHAHAIKSMSASMGAKQMKEIAETIERQSHDYEPRQAMLQAANLRSALQSYENSFRAYTSRH